MKEKIQVSKTQRKNRWLGIAFIFSLAVSTIFPVVASVINKDNRVMKIFGSFDVAIAIFSFILFAVIYTISRKHIDDKVIIRTKKIVEYIASLPLIFIALYLLGLNLNWPVLLIGLAWRFWLLIIAVPYIVKALQ